ncbi:MAG: hypothetical protein ACNS61_04810 [Candidatus Wenzhouxiangella sp. M2_3B_020]
MLALAGCAANGPDRRGAEAGLGPAERVAAVLVGSYAGRFRDGDAVAAETVRLHAEVGRADVDGVPVRMMQRSGDGVARRFGLVLEPTRVATRLEGRFSPLNEKGEAMGACPLTVRLRDDGFVATTAAATCRFGDGTRTRGLIKEIAHDGHRLVIADRVVGPDGERIGPDRVLELRRVRPFAGWAGIRDSAGAPWRVAEPFELESDGVARDPVDAAGVPLGISLELAPHQVRAGEPPVLRLRVFDQASGELVAQSWADPEATRIGVALPRVQVGLRLRYGPASRP